MSLLNLPILDGSKYSRRDQNHYNDSKKHCSNFNIFASEEIDGELIGKVLDSDNMVHLAGMMKNINILSEESVQDQDRCPCFLNNTYDYSVIS